MSDTYRLAYATPPSRVVTLLPARTSRVHVYVHAADRTAATRIMSEALGINLREGTLNKVTAHDAMPALLAKSGLLATTQGSTPAVLAHGPVGGSNDSVIIKISQYDTRIIGRIHGRGRSARLQEST